MTDASRGCRPSSAGTAACNARVYNRYVFSTILAPSPEIYEGLRAPRLCKFRQLHECRQLRGCRAAIPRFERGIERNVKLAGFEKFRLRGTGLAADAVFKTSWNSTGERRLCFGESLARARRKPCFTSVPRVMFKKIHCNDRADGARKESTIPGKPCREMAGANPSLYREKVFTSARDSPIVSKLFVRSSPTFTDSSSSVDYGCIKMYTHPVKNSGNAHRTRVSCTLLLLDTPARRVLIKMDILLEGGRKGVKFHLVRRRSNVCLRTTS